MALFFCITLLGNYNAFAEYSTNYVVIANYASIFKEASFSSEKIETISHGEKINLETDNDSPIQYCYDEFVFYKVSLNEEIEGFILSDLVMAEQNVITQIPNFNGQTNNPCVVYLLEDNNLVESDIILQKGQRFFLYEGYNSHTEFTKIAFLYDNKIIYGQIKTNFVKPDGINPIIITCIILTLAIIGIIFAWLFMRNKKIKLKKNKKFKIPKNN